VKEDRIPAPAGAPRGVEENLATRPEPGRHYGVGYVEGMGGSGPIQFANGASALRQPPAVDRGRG